ncbi:DUF3482 domain-containing protein [Candidatus Aalborgicola defluviihabitans]|uniref:DUF3482 domain-containing protein n=1 Tax=Candidatus Aalborgicola defluviihabitans TaxID=3386187 RepID=UPI003908EE10|nr:DUF3482 domain-containing protein [Burkholderiales bacterium]
MPIEHAAPAFAIIGAVNHGKSSIVSTLMEDDAVAVSSMPGVTVHAKRFALRDLVVFHDTPGFQNARKALAEINRAPADANDPLAKFRVFVEQHQADPQFEAECRLLKPVLAGAGIIYVVDGSLAPTPLNECEMELARLTGVTRLAIVNRTGEQDYIGQWRAALNRSFNAVREFNAHSASFEDRKDLLETLANINRDWKPYLLKAVTALQEDRSARIDDAAALAVSLVCDCLTFSARLSLKIDSAEARTAADLALQERFKTQLAKIESSAHNKMIALFAHHLVQSSSESASLFKDGLFSVETWRLMGLNAKQLTMTGAAIGAVAGAGTDALTLGHTLLLGTAVGAAIGGTTAYLVGKKQPSVSVKTPRFSKALQLLMPEKLQLSAQEMVVGPMQANNFPWILLDRALCSLNYVAGRAHGRRDETAIQMDQLLPSLQQKKLSVEYWSDEDRKRCEKLFAKLRLSKTLVGNESQELKDIIARHFGEVVASADRATH